MNMPLVSLGIFVVLHGIHGRPGVVTIEQVEGSNMGIRIDCATLLLILLHFKLRL